MKGGVIKLLRSFKKFKIKIFGNDIHLGRDVTIDYHVRVINKKSHIRIGDGVYLRSISKGYQAGMPFPTTLLLDLPGAELSIGSHSRINGVYIHAQKKIEIGKNCVFASGVNILDTNGHEVYSVNRTEGRDDPQPIIIGENVWIGLNAIILKGTVIEDNCIVSAGSVVSGKFPANSLIVGNPARIVKTLKI